MEENGPMIPNVWICLQKIRGYLDGDYDDEGALEDVYACLDTMDKMFEYMQINLKHESKLCRNGWPEDEQGGGGGN